MQLNTFPERLRDYLGSIFFPLTLAVLSFLMWLLPVGWSWVFACFYALLAFLPLLQKTDGKGYIPLMLFPVIIPNSDISLTNIPPYLYVIASSILGSIIIKIILQKPEFKRGDLFISLLLLYIIFLISYLYNATKLGKANGSALFYLLIFFGILALYALLSTILGKGESLTYYEKTVCLFSIAILTEMFVFYVRNGLEIGDGDFTLGWSYTPQTASTLLCLSLPFFALLISNRRPFWSIGFIAVCAGIILLSTDSGLLALIFFIIPLVVLSFRGYGKYYPYIAMSLGFALGVAFVILLATNDRFNSRVMTALMSLNLFGQPSTWRNTLFHNAMIDYLDNPVLGTSIISFTNATGTLTFASDTVLSVMVCGGTLGLLAYLYFEVRLYFVALRKQTPERWLFFIFLLIDELIGLIDNTMFNIVILLFFLIGNDVYQMSDRPEDVIIHDNDYRRIIPRRD